ncbi:MAG: substrate-binding domain-containing protein [Candidatus Ratteibacteria bacterium]
MGKGILTLIILTTTSLYDTGFLDKVVCEFEKEYKCKVKIISVGSGMAFKLGKSGEGDLLFVHEPEGEENFIKEGYGEKRIFVLKNEFVLCGPEKDPGKISFCKDIFDAFKNIYNKNLIFISRDDKSGTNIREKKIWEKIKINPEGKNWYIQTGVGMIESLRIAEEKSGYILSDISTFISHKNEFKNLKILLRDRKNLENFYSIIPVSSKKFPYVNKELTEKFIEFMKSEKLRKIVDEFKFDGERIFEVVE